MILTPRVANGPNFCPPQGPSRNPRGIRARRTWTLARGPCRSLRPRGLRLRVNKLHLATWTCSWFNSKRKKKEERKSRFVAGDAVDVLMLMLRVETDKRGLESQVVNVVASSTKCFSCHVSLKALQVLCLQFECYLLSSLLLPNESNVNMHVIWANWVTYIPCTV